MNRHISAKLLFFTLGSAKIVLIANLVKDSSEKNVNNRANVPVLKGQIRGTNTGMWVKNGKMSRFTGY